ncbi:hypothetical protein L7F22_046503 [Adiantum nelumboides]|nr:hypothetical protein [Adiantum nelumboides]
MPRYYCDYCDTYLTHDSPSVRKQHNAGYKHKANVRSYYQQFEEQQTQSLIDQKVKEHLGQAGYQQVGAAFHQHLAAFPSGPYRPPIAVPVLPVPGSFPGGIRPPVLPRPGVPPAGTKWACLLKLQMIVQIPSFPVGVRGKSNMKSIAMLSHGLSGIGNGRNNPNAFCLGDVPDDGEPDEQPEVEENEEILVPEQILAHKDTKTKGVIEGDYNVFKRGVCHKNDDLAGAHRTPNADVAFPENPG